MDTGLITIKNTAASLLLILIACVSATVTLANTSSNETPTNVILIAVDDMGYDTPASFGGRVEEGCDDRRVLECLLRAAGPGALGAGVLRRASGVRGHKNQRF